MNLLIDQNPCEALGTPDAVRRKRPRVLMLNLPAYGLVHRDVGCAYTSKSRYYYPQADLFMMAANVRDRAELHYLDCVIDRLSQEEMLRRVADIAPDHIFTIIASITETSDLECLQQVRKTLPNVRIWASGDLIYYTDRVFPELNYQVKDFTNHDQIIQLFESEQVDHAVIPVSGDRSFSVGICPHGFAKDRRYHNPYSLHAPVAMILTNWGCPFRCTFCAARSLQGSNKYKHRDEQEVLEEIRHVISLGFKEVYFRDFTFGIPRTEALVDMILASGLKFKWSCATRVDIVNERLLRKMKEAGCYLIFYGVDAAENELLRAIRKDLTTQDVIEKVRLTKEIGIEALTSFIVGFPGQDLEATRDFVFEMDPDYLSVSILMPTYGSDLRGHTEMWEERVLVENLNDSTYSDNVELVKFRNRLERDFYIRPGKLLAYLRMSLRGPRRIVNFTLSGFGLIVKWLHSAPNAIPVIGRRAKAAKPENA